jgi:hypothetical protein
MLFAPDGVDIALIASFVKLSDTIDMSDLHRCASNSHMCADWPPVTYRENAHDFKPYDPTR